MENKPALEGALQSSRLLKFNATAGSLQTYSQDFVPFELNM